ncbi:glycine/betaine ABC transporter ATP-binding protein [Paenibacillus naphthalenovorans]|uniref:Quaternary amine transport ATP-binding protein n=1 Tax=Paenibacillus naphthalenovorans TaxID=162209 RepID=A0A0U2W4F2_9BACL|nr:glycine/betaine ABC transporter ATP-binding protein [Paenibacillus naphthalenovorans]SDJ27475.1 glycine betaine/proline transport system ATP-binding protein [Paenibacillus naphthalenovorans]
MKNLTKIFGQSPEKALSLLEQGWSKKRIFAETKLTVGVNRANFTVKEGEIFVIMGLSGSGKSTLIRLINRLIEPTFGSITFQGENIVEMSEGRLREFRRTAMSMVFQKFALFPHRTVAQNVEFGLEIQKIPAKIRREKAREALALVGLEEWENSYPDQLSGGMQQRVGLARALANSPQVLLMDEAFSALDPLIRKDMQEELRELQEKLKKTIIFITHDLNEALRIGDRIALMKDGSIVQIGTPEEIMISPANEYVERFIEDVDLSRVLTASHVMRRPETMVYDRGGPRVALELMRENGISNLFVVDNSKRLIGVLTAEDTAQAIKENKGLDEIIVKDVPTVSENTLLNDLFELVSVSRVPVAVTSESGRLLGVIIRGAVLGALAGNQDRVRKAVSEDA